MSDDDPAKAALSRLDAERERQWSQINAKLDKILDYLKAIREDTAISQRITTLEDEIRRRR